MFCTFLIDVLNLTTCFLLDKDPANVWKEPKFQTQCWFLTLYAHHVALLPALQNHQRRIR